MSALSTSSRQTKSKQQALREYKNVAKTLQDSQLEFEKQQATDACSSPADITKKLDASQPWKTLHYSNSVTVCNIQHANDTGPQIKSAICIDKNLMLNAFVILVKLNKVGQFIFPMKVNSIHLIEQVCDTLNFLTYLSDNWRTENKHMLILNLIILLLIPLQADSF